MLEVLRSEIREVVSSYCTEPVHQDAILRALARPGFALHAEAPCRAGALTLQVYRSIRGSLDRAAFRAAAAVELQMEAAYMFDDVADEEVDPSYGLSAAEELALAIALMNCGAAAAVEAVRQAGREGFSLDSLLQFHRNYTSASGGQFLDATLEKRDHATTDEALQMTSLKAGSLGRFAAAFAAGIATDDTDTVNLFGEFGFNLLTYGQLIDDLRDACPTQGPQSDLLRQKKTVPLVFFENSRAAEHRTSSSGIMSPQTLGTNPLDLRQQFEASGAQVFTAVVAETFLNRAKSNLAELGERLDRIDSIERFIGSLEISPHEVLKGP